MARVVSWCCGCCGGGGSAAGGSGAGGVVKTNLAKNSTQIIPILDPVTIFNRPLPIAAIATVHIVVEKVRAQQDLTNARWHLDSSEITTGTRTV